LWMVVVASASEAGGVGSNRHSMCSKSVLVERAEVRILDQCVSAKRLNSTVYAHTMLREMSSGMVAP